MISGGGTGGHIYPALSIAKELQSRHPDIQLLYVGTRDGLEAQLAPRAGVQFTTIPVRGLVGKSPVQLARGLAVLAAGLWRARNVVRGFRPDVVVGTGGYVSGPVLLLAALSGVPTLIQEQNIFPGVTNRVLSRWAGVVAVPHSEAARYFPGRAHVVVTGNPVRRDVLDATREQAIERFHASPGRRQILIVGGSRGARRINEAVVQALPRLVELPVEVTWVTGARYHDQIQEQLDAAGMPPSAGGKLRVESYLHDLHLAYALADVFVGRAGAMTLAEITARGIPAVLIPSPNVTHDHQTYNARVLARAGAALMIPEDELNGKSLAAQLAALVNGPNTLKSMSQKSREQGRPGALDDIVNLIETLASGQRPG